MEEGGGFLFENETSLGTCEDSFEKNSQINGLQSQFWHQCSWYGTIFLANDHKTPKPCVR